MTATILLDDGDARFVEEDGDFGLYVRSEDPWWNEHWRLMGDKERNPLTVIGRLLKKDSRFAQSAGIKIAPAAESYAVVCQGWEGEGRVGRILGPNVHAGQEWTPILFNDERAPVFRASLALEELRSSATIDPRDEWWNVDRTSAFAGDGISAAAPSSAAIIDAHDEWNVSGVPAPADGGRRPLTEVAPQPIEDAIAEAHMRSSSAPETIGTDPGRPGGDHGVEFMVFHCQHCGEVYAADDESEHACSDARGESSYPGPLQAR